MKPIIWAAILALAPTSVAYAEEAKTDSAAAPRGQRSQVINFEDDTIEGDLTRPDGEYIEATKRVKHSNLIRIREEFKDKVMQSVDEL